MIRILLVDDHGLIRAGVRQLLEASENIRIVAEARCGEDALAQVQQKKIDIAVVDVQMPGMPVKELIQRLLKHYSPSIRSVVLTSMNEEAVTTELLVNGAYSYVTKSSDSKHLIKAIEKTMNSERYLSPDIAKQLAYHSLVKPDSDDIVTEDVLLLKSLSARELQCLNLLVAGKNVKEIAEALNINPKTINTYRYRIFQKLNVTTNIELIKLATRLGLFDESTTS